MALAQPAGGADAGETGADDQDVEVFGAGLDVVSLFRRRATLPTMTSVRLKRWVRAPDALLVSRRPLKLVIVAVALTAGVVTWSRASAPAPIPPPPPAPRTLVSCFRQGGDPDYCRCLDRFESARKEAGRPAGLPPLENPTIRYALRHPERYPIINADTLRCLAPRPAPRAPGVVATLVQ